MLHEHILIGTHWVALRAICNNLTYLGSFGAVYIPKEIKKFIGNKIIIANIYRKQAYD